MIPRLFPRQFAVAFFAVSFFMQLSLHAQDAPPKSCHVTLSSDGKFEPSPGALSDANKHYRHQRDRFWFGNEKLATILPTDGMWRTLFSDSNSGAYDVQLPWFRLDSGISQEDGNLTVIEQDIGRPQVIPRHINVPMHAGEQMVTAHIHLPTGGCWQITGIYNDQQLKFVVWASTAGSQFLP